MPPIAEDRELRIGFEVKVKREKAGNQKLVGYPARFNEMSEDLGGFREKIAPGAFKRSLGKSDVRALFDHDSSMVLGRNTAGTLKLKEDNKGLYAEITPDTRQTWQNDLMFAVERGDISQMSFAFSIREDTWDFADKNMPVRTINEVEELYDVSVVTYPAYRTTEVSLRRLEHARQVVPSPEEHHDTKRYSEAADAVSTKDALLVHKHKTLTDEDFLKTITTSEV